MKNLLPAFCGVLIFLANPGGMHLWPLTISGYLLLAFFHFQTLQRETSFQKVLRSQLMGALSFWFVLVALESTGVQTALYRLYGGQVQAFAVYSLYVACVSVICASFVVLFAACFKFAQ